jgi:flagellar hook-basal body complex protein FliE
MSINAIGGFAANFVKPTATVGRAEGLDRAQGPKESGFSASLESAIQSVDDQQHQADSALQELGAGNGSLHDSMIALTEAQIAMELMVSVRDKVVSAYEQIMNMSI